MRFDPLPIEGAYRITPAPAEDARGLFARTFCAETFAKHGLVTDFVQRSISFNRRSGTLRGLHYQAPPYQETKIVRCTRGGAFDVIVDLRAGTPGFGAWHAVELTADNRTSLYVPVGCAHGFQALVDDTEIYYEITPAYVPEAARGIRYDDPDLSIAWPLPDPILSERDRELPPISHVAVEIS